MAKKETKAVLDNFTIKSYVDSLFESNAGMNQRLTHFLNEYQKVLAEGATKEFMLYEEFGHGLANFASTNKAVKKIINEMNTNLATYGKELNTYKLMECICDDAAKCACEDAYTHYLASGDNKSKEILTSAVDVLEQTGDPVAPQLTIVIANPAAQLEPQQISTFDGASKFDEIQRKIEEDKLRQKVEDAKAEIDAYAEKKYAEMKAVEEAERNANVYDNVVNKNGICLGESIKNIMNSEAKTNKKLVETLEQYKGALNQGLYEERLYEGFIKNITPFNYLTAVNKEIKRLEKVAEDHQVSINVTKILEEMYTTNSYYILPLIEEDACRFIKNPTEVNCNQLKAALVSFNGDPYCRAIMEELDSYNDKPSFLLNDKTLTIKDRAKLIKEHANISNIYSPVQYIKENECVFNVNGQFYVKKGNTLARISEEYIPQLSESFITLCQLVNDPHVIMNEDHITLVGNNKIANIFEDHIDINGNDETIDTVRNLNEMQMKYDFDNNFFIMTACLAENFNNIANVNFAKHVALNEDEGIYVDLFNLNGNIFINAVNEAMLNATFYHDVNPIQCRNLINNHMGINVSYLFEDLIPSQDKFYLKLNETKNEYETSIAKYEATIEKLKKAKEDDLSEDSEKKLDAAIEAAQAKVDELKKEYKDWQDDVDKVTNPENNKSEKKKESDDEPAEDDNTEVEKSNEPIDAEDVEDAKADLSTPLSQEGHDLSVSDDEFDDYLEGNSEVPGEEMDNTEVNMSHHALAGDGKENEKPNPDELDDPMNAEDQLEEPSDEFTEEPVDNDEDAFAEINTEEPDEFDKEINGEEEMTVEPEEGDSEETEEPINFEGDEEIKTPDDYASEEPVSNPEYSEAPGEPGAPAEVEGVVMPEGYKIADIKFDQNLKTGELFKTGSITVMVDMVDASGKVYTESNIYHFYVDEETHLPIIDAADIPVALYNALVASIQADEQFNEVDAHGVANSEEPAHDEVYYNADDVNKASDELEKNDDEAYFDFKDDGNGDITFTAKEETPVEDTPAEVPTDSEDIVPAEAKPAKPVKASDLFNGVEDEPDEEEVITPTYQVDDTVIDKPAENIEFEEPAEGEENPFASEDSAEAEETSNDVKFDSDEKDFPDFDEVEIDDEIEKSEDNIPAQNASTSQPTQSQQSVKESVKVDNKKITLNEARAAFVKLKAEYKKVEDEKSFINEGASKPSKKEVNSLDEGKTPQISVINKLYEYAQQNAEKPVTISEIKSVDDVTYFSINNIPNKNESMAIYEMDNKVYYGNYEDLSDVLDGIVLGVNSKKDLELLESEQPQCVSSEFIKDGYDLINTILGESCKIKKPSLTTNGDIKLSKKMADITNGTKDRQEFEKKVEREAKQAGVPNPLVPQQQQESVNVEEANELSESVVDKNNIEFIYEPMDWVIIKENGMKAQVQDVVNDGDGNLTMLTILASNGVTYDATPDEIEPDPIYLANLPGSVVNSTLLGVPRLATFDVNPKTRLTDNVNNDDPALEEKYKDFN